MAVMRFLAFLPMARKELTNIVSFDHDLRPWTRPDGLLVPLSHDVRRAIEEIGVFAVFLESDFDVVYAFIACSRTKVVPWSENSSICLFLYS